MPDVDGDLGIVGFSRRRLFRFFRRFLWFLGGFLGSLGRRGSGCYRRCFSGGGRFFVSVSASCGQKSQNC